MHVTNQSLKCHLSPNDTSTQIINFILEAQWMLYFMTLIKHLAAIYPSILFIFKNPYQNLTKTAHKFEFYSLAKLTGSPLCLQPDPSWTLGLGHFHPQKSAFSKPTSCFVTARRLGVSPEEHYGFWSSEPCRGLWGGQVSLWLGFGNCFHSGS